MLVVIQKHGLRWVYFLSIPNGLLVSVNEEPVHAIGILSLSDPQFSCVSVVFETESGVAATDLARVAF